MATRGNAFAAGRGRGVGGTAAGASPAVVAAPPPTSLDARLTTTNINLDTASKIVHLCSELGGATSSHYGSIPFCIAVMQRIIALLHSDEPLRLNLTRLPLDPVVAAFVDHCKYEPATTTIAMNATSIMITTAGRGGGTTNTSYAVLDHVRRAVAYVKFFCEFTTQLSPAT
jgi:hypothetical protein